MKNKRIHSTIALLLMVSGIIAQDKSISLFSVPLSDPGKPGKLIIDQIAGSIRVAGYEGTEVVLRASFEDNKHHSKKKANREGMKRIESASMNISAEEKDNVVRVINEQWNSATNFDVKVPVNFSLKLSTVNEGDIWVKNVNGEMEISNVNGEITMESIKGSASADTVNGDIEVVFERITQDANMAFSSLNGDVEITFPSTLKANVKAKSDMGEIYTDFDMQIETQKPEVNKNNSSGVYKVKIEQWVRGKINGGGPEMLFKTFNGDILIKSK